MYITSCLSIFSFTNLPWLLIIHQLGTFHWHKNLTIIANPTIKEAKNQQVREFKNSAPNASWFRFLRHSIKISIGAIYHEESNHRNHRWYKTEYAFKQIHNNSHHISSVLLMTNIWFFVFFFLVFTFLIFD